ncbi:hypothetical protein cyc_06456 [Cyclospora cayetanensis]|uniref:Transmembrane protein n=1 Tax=Cyclospora cayetanensis TaxID=88456 RepID=A0A1D3D6P8_9EIME|nr:hypothetical protein cyc_06456 [Cyclospora cayetanensis]
MRRNRGAEGRGHFMHPEDLHVWLISLALLMVLMSTLFFSLQQYRPEAEQSWVYFALVLNWSLVFGACVVMWSVGRLLSSSKSDWLLLFLSLTAILLPRACLPFSVPEHMLHHMCFIGYNFFIRKRSWSTHALWGLCLVLLTVSDVAWGVLPLMLALFKTMGLLVTIIMGWLAYRIVLIFRRQMREVKRSGWPATGLQQAAEVEGRLRLRQHRAWRRAHNGACVPAYTPACPPPKPAILKRFKSFEPARHSEAASLRDRNLRRSKTQGVGLSPRGLPVTWDHLLPSLQEKTPQASERRRYWTTLDNLTPLYNQAVQRRLKLLRSDLMRCLPDTDDAGIFRKEKESQLFVVPRCHYGCVDCSWFLDADLAPPIQSCLCFLRKSGGFKEAAFSARGEAARPARTLGRADSAAPFSLHNESNSGGDNARLRARNSLTPTHTSSVHCESLQDRGSCRTRFFQASASMNYSLCDHHCHSLKGEEHIFSAQPGKSLQRGKEGVTSSTELDAERYRHTPDSDGSVAAGSSAEHPAKKKTPPLVATHPHSTSVPPQSGEASPYSACATEAELLPALYSAASSRVSAQQQSVCQRALASNLRQRARGLLAVFTLALHSSLSRPLPTRMRQYMSAKNRAKQEITRFSLQERSRLLNCLPCAVRGDEGAELYGQEEVLLPRAVLGVFEDAVLERWYMLWRSVLVVDLYKASNGLNISICLLQCLFGMARAYVMECAVYYGENKVLGHLGTTTYEGIFPSLLPLWRTVRAVCAPLLQFVILIALVLPMSTVFVFSDLIVRCRSFGRLRSRDSRGIPSSLEVHSILGGQLLYPMLMIPLTVHLRRVPEATVLVICFGSAIVTVCIMSLAGMDFEILVFLMLSRLLFALFTIMIARAFENLRRQLFSSQALPYLVYLSTLANSPKVQQIGNMSSRSSSQCVSLPRLCSVPGSKRIDNSPRAYISVFLSVLLSHDQPV